MRVDRNKEFYTVAWENMFCNIYDSYKRSSKRCWSGIPFRKSSSTTFYPIIDECFWINRPHGSIHALLLWRAIVQYILHEQMFQQKNPEFLLTKPKRPLKMEKKVSTSCREASGFRTNIQKPAFLKVLQNPEYQKSIFWLISYNCNNPLTPYYISDWYVGKPLCVNSQKKADQNPSLMIQNTFWSYWVQLPPQMPIQPTTTKRDMKVLISRPSAIFC